MQPGLADVIKHLYALEINVGLQTFYDDGLTVWIGDELNGRHVERFFRMMEFDEIAPWLLAEAARREAEPATNPVLGR